VFVNAPTQCVHARELAWLKASTSLQRLFEAGCLERLVLGHSPSCLNLDSLVSFVSLRLFCLSEVLFRVIQVHETSMQVLLRSHQLLVSHSLQEVRLQASLHAKLAAHLGYCRCFRHPGQAISILRLEGESHVRSVPGEPVGLRLFHLVCDCLSSSLSQSLCHPKRRSQPI
jgi:hypothetical protein